MHLVVTKQSVILIYSDEYMYNIYCNHLILRQNGNLVPTVMWSPVNLGKIANTKLCKI